MIGDHKNKKPYFLQHKKSSDLKESIRWRFRRTTISGSSWRTEYTLWRSDIKEIVIVKTHNPTFGQLDRRRQQRRQRNQRRMKEKFRNRLLISGKKIHLLPESFGHRRSFDFRTFHCLLYGWNLSFKFFLFIFFKKLMTS